MPLLRFLLFFCILAPAAAIGSENLGDNRRQLEDIEQRIDETARNLRAKRSAGLKLGEDLETVTKEEKRLREKIGGLEREAAELQARLMEMTAQVETSRAQTVRTETLVRQRLAALYKRGETGPLQLFFSNLPASQFIENYDYFGRIVRRDRALLQDYRRQLVELEAAQRSLAAVREERQGALAVLQKDRQALLQAVRVKEKLLARVRMEEEALGGELAELKARAKRLSALIKKLESTKPREYTSLVGAFSAQKGSLPWPVGGRVRVGFGTSRNPESGTLRDSQGIEIETTAEQAIAAVWPGRVIFADSFKGFGKMLILDHGDGYYTLYAQAARLSRKVGEQVAGGTVLAHAGGDRLYFEVRHHGVPLNPANWLAGQ